MASGLGNGNNMDMQLRKWKYSRRGKKGAITKRIRQLEKLMHEGGKKRMIDFLCDALKKVFEELSEVCMEISTLEDEDDEYNEIEDVRIRVETCVALVADHLENRSDRSSSTAPG